MYTWLSIICAFILIGETLARFVRQRTTLLALGMNLFIVTWLTEGVKKGGCVRPQAESGWTESKIRWERYREIKHMHQHMRSMYQFLIPFIPNISTKDICKSFCKPSRLSICIVSTSSICHSKKMKTD